jgi:hypothetical protein
MPVLGLPPPCCVAWCSYVPVEDGFVTTAGKSELGAKYGNHTGAARLSAAVLPPPPIASPPPVTSQY